MSVTVLDIRSSAQIKSILEQLCVDPYGIRIMLPKARQYVLKTTGLSAVAANIVKQEFLAAGADAALPRDILTKKIKHTDCVMFATLAQFDRICAKLTQQPFGLKALSCEIKQALQNYTCNNFKLELGRYRLNISKRTHIMGIINLTPDSFSADGMYSAVDTDQQRILDYAHKLAEEGADILDIGGESSRPQAKSISLKEELKRTIPTIRLITKKIKIPVSIDTCKPEVAKQALDHGAVIVNDITGLADQAMAKTIAKYKAAVVIMHMQGKPSNMQNKPVYKDLLADISYFLTSARDKAQNAGINRAKIILDPGIGFGKTLGHNLTILNRLAELKSLGQPLLVGTSRKKFIGLLTNTSVDQRIPGTIASCVLAAAYGANIVRVHDVKQAAQALKVADAIIN